MNTLKAAFTSYLSHLVAYTIAAVTVVSTLNPKALPPQYAFLTAVAGSIVAAFSHGKAVQANGGAIATAVADALTAAVNTAATVAPAVTKVAMILLVLPVLFALHGCASVQSFLSSPTGADVVTAGVQVAVATAEQKGITAAQINSVAKAVLANDQGVATSVAGLTTVVNAQLVKLNIPAGDIAAFQGLEIAFDAYITAKYGSNATAANLQADAALFLNAAIADTGG